MQTKKRDNTTVPDWSSGFHEKGYGYGYGYDNQLGLATCMLVGTH